ncbi:MAG TPA: PrsW family glutamic-type intramembrane protease, partial [Thermoanaerobaculia bacterium]|nr:PrsW family glutamic-type intramembrane protease [Thermoanaerobaculia bacterium]
MSRSWFFLEQGRSTGPVDEAGLAELFRTGRLNGASWLWFQGLAAWQTAEQLRPSLPPNVAAFLPPAGPAAAPPPPPSGGQGPLHGLAAGLSRYADLPTLTGVPVAQVLMGGLGSQGRPVDIEEELVVGTASTTPPLSSVATVWPRPRIFWRIFGAAFLTYLFLYLAFAQFHNGNVIPGLIVVGSFMVPLSVLMLFFELNVPRNVSFYQTARMFLFGGALSLLATLVVSEFVPGGGVQRFIPALLTGVVEESGKALALLLVVGVVRYRWQLNGLLLGGAVGAGFAGFESAGYALGAALESQSVAAATMSILIRGILAPGGHVIWTAMVGSAIWKVKGERPFSLGVLFHPTV